MVRIACTMMLKNEDALLEPWLAYHGALFGFDHLYVFDNGSTSQHTIDVLNRFEARGIHLNRSFPTIADYKMKGEIIAACIRALQEHKAYDVVFPLDCDEFVLLESDEGPKFDRDSICNYAATLVAGGGLLRVGTQHFNVINRPGEFASNGYLKTVIILDGTFVGSDHGHHHCTTSTGSNYRPCQFSYIHYHYKPLLVLQEHARYKLAPFVDVDDPAAVAAFEGPGHHLKSYLQMTDDQFQNWHKGSNFLTFPAFAETLAALGTGIPF